jgi:hypothetical protein
LIGARLSIQNYNHSIYLAIFYTERITGGHRWAD